MARLGLIQTEKGLKPFFKKMVEGAIYNQNLEVTDISQFYLVNMLDEFSKTEELFAMRNDHYEETPLAFLLNEALNSEPTRRIRIFKKLGDISLYIAGYFSDHIDSKLVDVNYYISMGEGAYGNLSGILSNEKTFSRLYGELSQKFVEFMGVLSEVRYTRGAGSNSEIVKLYEQWLRTGNTKIRERLEKEGIVI